MRLLEMFLIEQVEREYTLSIWVDYAAHRGDLEPDQFANRSRWLESILNEIAERSGFGSTGGGGFIGEWGGSRDISFESDSMNLEKALQTAQQVNRELKEFQQGIEDTVAKLGMNSRFEFDYSISLNLEDDIEGSIMLGGYGNIEKLIAGTVSIEQLIDDASEDIMESKSKKSVKVDIPKPRNFVAKNAKTSGAGSHKTKSKKLKRDEKKLRDK